VCGGPLQGGECGARGFWGLAIDPPLGPPLQGGECGVREAINPLGVLAFQTVLSREDGGPCGPPGTPPLAPPLQGGECGVRGAQKALSVLFVSFVFFVLKNPAQPRAGDGVWGLMTPP
jgi:hypothetical protein